jgi:hypothetical protein
MDVKDCILEFYKINYDYQNTKEQMFWLAATLYLGFAGAAIAWACANVGIVQRYRPLIGVFSLTVWIFSECFILYQNWYKSRGVFVDELLCDLLRRFDAGMKRPKYWEVCAAMQAGPGTPRFGKLRLFMKNGRTGIIAMILVLAFGIAQIAVVSLI